MERIKAFYPSGTENVIHLGRNGNVYYLDAIDLQMRIHDSLISNTQVTIINVDNPDDSVLLNTHTQDLLEAYKTGYPKGLAESSGLLWNKDFYKFVVNTAWTSIEACRAAIVDGKSIAITAGGHHSEKDRGMGFDPIANLIIATRKLISDRDVDRIAILDLDVHYGNGNNLLATDIPQLLYCDLWKYKVENTTVSRNSKNIHSLKVNSWKDYMVKLNKMFRIIDNFDPSLVVVINGLDVLDTDRIGGMSGFNNNELNIRSKSVGNFLCGHNYPTAVFTAGGYIDHTMSKEEIETAKNKLTKLYIESIFSIMNCEKKKTPGTEKVIKSFI